MRNYNGFCVVFACLLLLICFGTCAQADFTKKCYYEHFNDQITGGFPDGWSKIAGSCAVANDSFDPENKIIKFDSANAKCIIGLHLFAKDVTFKTRFRLADVQGSGVWLGCRYNIDGYSMVKAGYDLQKQQWRIIDHWNGTSYLKASCSETLVSNQWYELKLTADQTVVKLYVNGELKCQADNILDNNYGQLTIYAEDANVDFDNVSYSGLPPVRDGVISSIINYPANISINGNIVKLGNGDLMLHVGGSDKFLCSKNNGLSWNTTDWGQSLNYGSMGAYNVIKLKSGKLLNFFEIKESPVPDYQSRQGVQVSNDDGQSWEGPYWIQNEVGPYHTVNSKVRQTSNGRVFWPTSCGGAGGAAELDGGGLAIYYSDDDGVTWHESVNRLTLETTGRNLQEGEIVEIRPNHLRLVCRSDHGQLCYSESRDNGKNWSTDIVELPLPSTMCAFNFRKDIASGEIFAFWVYEDIAENSYPQLPRNRLALARSSDGMRSWDYLMDVDDFEGLANRFYNLGLYLDDNYIYAMANLTLDGDYNPENDYLKITRIERGRLCPYDEFPQLH